MSRPDRTLLYGPWLPRLTRGHVRQITPDELKRWIICEDERVLVFDKPGDVLCHPSKDGPWSSLVGAAREYLGAAAVHLVFRLDRETSGVVLLAKTPAIASRLQTAAQERRYHKRYLAILVGELKASVTVNQPLGDDPDSPVLVKSKVVATGEGQVAVTHFNPLAHAGGFTLASVTTETGRKHQIRAHAQWLNYPLVGDKIYGPDPALFLDFIEHGWSPRLAEKLYLDRQALHCVEIDLRLAGETTIFHAPLPADMSSFCREKMAFSDATLTKQLSDARE